MHLVQDTRQIRCETSKEKEIKWEEMEKHGGKQGNDTDRITTIHSKKENYSIAQLASNVNIPT